MPDCHIAIGLAILGVIVTCALDALYDAWRYSHHPNESVRRELVTWGSLVVLWASAVAVAAHV